MNSENFKIIGVSSSMVIIEIVDPAHFDQQFNLGSYIKIPYKNDSNKYAVGIVENYKIKDANLTDTELPENVGSAIKQPSFIIELKLTGTLSIEDSNIKFERGSYGIPLPPNNGIELLNETELKLILKSGITEEEEFYFSHLVQNNVVRVPVNGNKFFNKHFAIVGSTGSGKSNTVAKVLQEAVKGKKSGGFDGLNNSHIIIFDIHKEYKNAFPEANYIENNLILPYWLLNEDELEELFLESGDRNNYNQSAILRKAIIENKRKYSQLTEVHFGTPTKFDITEVYNCLYNLQNETLDYNDNLLAKFDSSDIKFKSIEEKYQKYFEQKFVFKQAERSKIKGGYYTDGTLDKFIERFEIKINNPRLKFLFGEDSRNLSFEMAIRQFLGANSTKSNITIFDLGGIPFEVLSITVSLISRILFEFGYYSKKLQNNDDCQTPLLLVYEEAHKYVPKSDLVKFRASKLAIERIAKEGRKYGITLGIVSQRPSEISETIFSQCNSFITMRLTNPEDQYYVKRLLPDSLGDLTDMLPTLKAGDALLIGESVTIPSLVHIERCSPPPKSSDIKYYEIWKKPWIDVDFAKIIEEWRK